MIITTDRSPLDNSLNDPMATVFILLGGTGSKAAEVHETMEGQNWQDYQTYYLVIPSDLVNEEEKQQWFLDKTSECYAVLGGTVPSKTVATQGPITELLTADEPDSLKINAAMVLGDQVVQP